VSAPPPALARRVAVRVDPGYERGALAPPFRPPNSTYDAVRALLREWSGRDGDSPLADVIEPGMRVVVKPNLVLDRHPAGEAGSRATVTDAAVLRPVLDCVAAALRGSGTIVLADSPIRMTDLGALLRWSGLDRVLDDVAERYGVAVETVDIRDATVADVESFPDTLRVKRQAGDPRGGLRVDLGTHSLFEELEATMPRLRSTAAVGRNEVSEYHRPGRHVYELSRTVLDGDFIVSVPKLKTHKKAGMTCALKNYVGAVIRKEWLPHHRQGPPSAGGDEFPDDLSPRLKLRERAKDLHMQSRAGSVLLTPAKWLWRRTLAGTRFDPVHHPTQIKLLGGGWSGNDTCWRMVHDLVRALFYADAEGRLGAKRVRQQLSIVDGLIAGEGDGPLAPSPRRAGTLIAGLDPVWVDWFATLLMGYDPAKIPLVARAVAHDHPLPLTPYRRDEIDLVCTPDAIARALAADRPLPDAFVPPLGWARHLGGERAYALAAAMQTGPGVDY
jgi:uncharacterized protein (DUF362 family)